jgi:hypothetical protein
MRLMARQKRDEARAALDLVAMVRELGSFGFDVRLDSSAGYGATNSVRGLVFLREEKARADGRGEHEVMAGSFSLTVRGSLAGDHEYYHVIGVATLCAIRLWGSKFDRFNDLGDMNKQAFCEPLMERAAAEVERRRARVSAIEAKGAERGLDADLGRDARTFAHNMERKS